MQIADFKNMLLISYQIDNSFNSYPMAKKFAQHVSPPKKRKEKKPNLEITYIYHMDSVSVASRPSYNFTPSVQL